MKLNKVTQSVVFSIAVFLISIFVALSPMSPMSPMSHSPVQAVDGRWYSVWVKHSDQCLNILGASYDNGAPAAQGSACSGSNFAWKFIWLV